MVSQSVIFYHFYNTIQYNTNFIGHCTCTLQRNLSSAFNPSLIGSSVSRGSWCPSPAVYGQEAGYTLDRSPVHQRSEYPKRTHAFMGGEHVNSMQKDPPARSRTQELLAARQQCYQLCHHAAPEIYSIYCKSTNKLNLV
ncbi:hypothetical protein ILYODFUR_012328 [Ilyodon furcidens]|uniref:Uncharacterized protein n=1 Tax=Ilyodon furcidens TaxID=33524 RepID=A0ABV0UTM3_9TELE